MKKVFFFLMFSILLLVPLASALNLDNTKSFIKDQTTSPYGKIEIKNAFGFGSTLASYELKKNTDYCQFDCYAEGETIFYSSGTLFDSMKFQYLKGSKTTPQYQILVKDNNNTYIQYTNQVYQNGEKVEWMIKGKKEASQTVDWIAKAMGNDLNEWALWTGNNSINLSLFYRWDENGAYSNLISVDATGKQNGTNNNVAYSSSIKVYGNSAINISQLTSNVTIPNNYFNDLAQGTVEVWVNRTNDTAQGYVINKEQPSVANYFGIYFNETGNVCFEIESSCVYSNITVPLGTWHQIAVTWNGSERNVYIDSNKTGRIVDTKVLANANFPTQIGAQLTDGSKRFIGYMDEFMIFNQSRNATEIFTDMVQGETNVFVTLNSISDGSLQVNSTLQFNATLTSPRYQSILNRTLYIWHSNSTLFNETTISTSGFPLEAFHNVSGFQLGNYFWNVLGCTALGCNFAQNNFSFQLGINPAGNTYNVNTYETLNETFYTNISIIPTETLLTANFIYKNENYTGNIINLGGGDYILYKTIDIPLGVGTNNWTWNVIYEGGVSQTLDALPQTVSEASYKICDGTNPYLAVNFSTWNESAPTQQVSPTWKSTFTYYLGGGTVTKNISNSLLANTTFPYCINSNHTYYTNSIITLTADYFYTKLYQFNKAGYNNNSIEQKLYLFPQDEGTAITIQVKDIGLSPLPNYIVKVYRYYPELNDYLLVTQDKTDIYGQIGTRMVERTVKYRLDFYDSDNILRKATQDLTVICPSSGTCILPFTINVGGNDVGRLQNISNYNYALTFNNNSNTFTATWNDNTGKNPTHRLFVERYLFNGTTTICNTSSTAILGSLNCSVGNTKASYQAQLFRTPEDGSETRISVISAKVGDVAAGIFGFEGLLWGFLLLMTLCAVGYWYPPVGIALYLFGFVALGIIGVVYISPAIIIANLVLGILFIWAFRG